jgi:hypothetical protein
MNRKLKDKWNELVDNGLLQVTIVALGSAAIILLAIILRWHQFPTPTHTSAIVAVGDWTLANPVPTAAKIAQVSCIY